MNLDGNFMSRFGDRLPVPYMEKIVIRDASIEVQMSLYIKPPNEEEIDASFYTDYIESLASLNVSIVTVNDGLKTEKSDIVDADGVDSGYSYEDETVRYFTKYGPISFSETGTGIFDKLLTGEANILQVATPTNKTSYDPPDVAESLILKEQTRLFDEVAWIAPNCTTTIFNEKLELTETNGYSTEELYDSSGALIYKYTKNIVIDNIIEAGPSGDHDFDTVESYIQAIVSGLETHLVCFTNSIEQFPNDFTDQQRKEIVTREPVAEILFNQVSDLSYERIAADKAIKSSEINIFKTTTGEIYTGKVFQAIDGMYHGNSTVTSDNVIATFTDLIGTTTDPELQEKFDSLAFLLMVHGKETNIMAKLNDFRKTFVETSTAVPVGRLHEKLEIRLYNTNNAIKRGIPVQKTFNISPTVIDARSRPSTPYEEPYINDRYDVGYADNYLYTKRAKLGAYAIPAGLRFSTEEAQAAADEFSAIFDELMEGVQQAETQCYDSLRDIYVRVADAFSDMSDDYPSANMTSEGIPEMVPTEMRLIWSEILGSYSDSARFEPVTINAANGYPIFTPAMEAANLAKIDSEFSSLSDQIPITLKIWPYHPSFYSNVWHAAGIVTTNRQPIDFEEEIRPILRSATARSKQQKKIYYGLDMSDMNMKSSQERDPQGNSGAWAGSYDDYWKKMTSSEGGAGSRNKDIIPDLSGWLIVQQADDDMPNYFVEVATEILYFGIQSGGSTVITKVDEKDTWQEKLGLDGNDSETASPTFDPDNKIQDQITIFEENYKVYIELAKAAYQASKNAQVYAQVAALGGLAGVDLIYTQYNLFLKGFVFFDYEKALKRASNISKIFNVDKVEKLFGKQLSHTYFKVMSIEMEKFFDMVHYDRDPTLPVEAVMGSVPLELTSPVPGTVQDYLENQRVRITYTPPPSAFYPQEPESLGSMISYPSNATDAQDAVRPEAGLSTGNTKSYYEQAITLPDYIEYQRDSQQYGANDAKGAKMGITVENPSWGVAATETSQKTEFSYVIPRSFQFSSPDANNDYRLVCYEFQDVAGSFEVGAYADGFGQPTGTGVSAGGQDFGADFLFDQNQYGNSYLLTLIVKDRTKDMYANIVRTFSNAMNQFETYYQSAIEQCSHNLSDERMNQFFIDGSIASYSAEPHLAPWYVVPLVYLTHVDLLTDIYGGSEDEMKAAAIDLSQRLHPANATLSELESFRDRLQNLWSENYQSGGPEGSPSSIASGLEWSKDIVFGGFESIDGNVAMLPNLPAPVNLDYLGYSYLTGDVVSVDVDDLT